MTHEFETTEIEEQDLEIINAAENPDPETRPSTHDFFVAKIRAKLLEVRAVVMQRQQAEIKDKIDGLSAEGIAKIAQVIADESK